jgi:hypothetical protein
MRTMSNRSLLTAARRKAKENEGSALIDWYTTSEDDRFVNLRNIRLVVVVDKTVHIMVGTVTRNPDGDQQLLFASKGLCRIKNGRRRGMIVEPSRLRVGEDAASTGLVKPLMNGSKSNSFRMNDERDSSVIARIHEAFDDAVPLDDIVIPDTYIRGRSAMNLTMRLSGDVTKQLMGCVEYNRRLPMEDNFHNLIGGFSVSDKGYKLYPFRMVQGTGMVIVDLESMPPPLLIPRKALDKEHNLVKVMI